MPNLRTCAFAAVATLTVILTPLAVSWAQCSASAPDAEVFAAALADSGKTFRGTLGPGGDELYFFRKVGTDPAAEDYRIFVSRLRGGRWSAPEKLTLGGEYSDLYPVLSPDGRRLVFTSYRAIAGDTSSHPSANLWYAERSGSGWGPPVPIRNANALGSYHSQPIFSGERLVFRRTSPDWRTSQTLVTRWERGAYSRPEPFETVERWADWRPDMQVWGGIPGPDDDSVVLEISRLDPQTKRPLPSDLWVSTRVEGRWTEPRRLGAGVNTEGQFENFPALSPDGCNLLFVRGFSRFYQVSLAALLAPE